MFPFPTRDILSTVNPTHVECLSLGLTDDKDEKISIWGQSLLLTALFVHWIVLRCLSKDVR